ncbi:FAD-dependent oxidoreductase [Actinomadura madurae]|uniref:FAD-dependent oxidoreductase n=1 Tax=Actinomadura madurae TaxID=1993 RepID=UPI00399AA39A
MAIVIVGASVAGIRTVQALRKLGSEADITVIGEEPHHPYDKPPLSKEMLLRSGAPGAVPLLTVDELAALDVDLRLRARAVALDPDQRVVRTADGGAVHYDELVIATGATPRTLPFETPNGVHTIRTADDATALRDAMGSCPRVTVVGAGFVGAEFASAAHDLGCAVTIVEKQRVPMAHILGPEVGAVLADLHRANGVDLHTNVTLRRLDANADGSVTGAVLDDGRVLPADLVVVGIGVCAATDWLIGSGLPIEDGVDCDDRLRVVGHHHIHAAGDVARWPHPLYDNARLRIEHWTNANEHAAVVAADILGLPPPATQLPYVWSDQYGHRIQIVGRPGIGSLARRHGDAHTGLTALYADSNGVAVGAVVVDDPRSFMRIRRAISKGSTVEGIDVPAA